MLQPLDKNDAQSGSCFPGFRVRYLKPLPIVDNSRLYRLCKSTMNQLQTLYFDSIRNLPHETLDPTESTDMGMANIETKTTDMVYMAKLEYIGHDPLKLYKRFVGEARHCFLQSHLHSHHETLPIPLSSKTIHDLHNKWNTSCGCSQLADNKTYQIHLA